MKRQENNKPSFCKIGFREFKIDYKPLVKTEKGEIVYGQIHHDKHYIEISTQFNIEHNKNAMLHEILHGIEVHYFGQNTFSENQIEILTNGLMDFIRANKEMINWIMNK